MKIYDDNRNVLDAARERISLLFDNFETINVSISSGKDSTVLYFLALQEAIKRKRKIVAFFQDQEAEYMASIDLMKILMNHPNVIPAWYQVPIYMTNATSYSDYFLYAWGPGEAWMRGKDPIAIHSIDEDYPKRFYQFFDWYENKYKDAAFLIGLRADESLTRYRAVTKHPGWNNIPWSTGKGNAAVRFYPIYDWTVYDVWKFIYDFDLPYNKIYDLMFMANYTIYNRMRVSNLVHEKSFKCLVDLPKFEPETYNKLCKRIGGIATASRYASEKLVFDNKTLPVHYKNWKEFRDFLLENIPNQEHRRKFEARYAKQEQTERMYQSQVGQLLINDYENARSYDTKRSEKTQKLKEKWMEIL
ncbi:MAG: phosphoadenosine phosphosulfate reductase family protein [Bacteroidales bacterium]|nr:phosphoadenosine phosphosulfate reductase family protein [Bacteroidales bacterium]MBN2749967.1 phosphoadenosine phosphosulfate reductase family protein [Bacteroidales bacterium]